MMITPVSTSRGEHTRQAILEAANSLFLEQGFAATTMRQIAQRAGLTPGGIYNHFASKEAIFEVLFAEKHPYQQVFPILLSTPGDNIETFVHNTVQILEAELNKRPDFIKLMFIEIIEFNSQHIPDLMQTIYPQVVSFGERFSQADSRIRTIPPVVILRTFVGLFFSHYIFQYMTGASQAPGLQDVPDLEQAINIFLYGILKPPETV